MHRHFPLRLSLASTLLATSALLCTPAAQAFGIGDLVNVAKPAAGSASVDPDGFLKAAANAEKLMSNSLKLLLGSLSSKEEAAKFDAKMQAAEKSTDPAEVNAQKLEIQKEAAATIAAESGKADIKNRINKLDSAQRKQLGAAAFNFSLALLQDKALIDQSKGLISGMSANPALLGKLGNVKDAVSSLTNQIETGSKVGGLMPEIFSTVGVKAPASKDDKPKEMTVSNDV